MTTVSSLAPKSRHTQRVKRDGENSHGDMNIYIYTIVSKRQYMNMFLWVWIWNCRYMYIILVAYRNCCKFQCHISYLEQSTENLYTVWNQYIRTFALQTIYQCIFSIQHLLCIVNSNSLSEIVREELIESITSVTSYRKIHLSSLLLNEK